MDYVLDFADKYFFTPHVYPKTWPEDDIYRQLTSLMAIVTFGGALIYLIPAILSYYFIFDHNLMKHPKFLKNQVSREIKCALSSVPLMALPTALLFVAEVRGFSKLYDTVDSSNGGWPFLMLSFFTFVTFTDFCIYWIHRWLHHPILYKPLHKIHHTWKVPTPFASHAFHPLDGFLQSLPYHVYPFVFPLHKTLYLCLFVFVNLWSTGIHDGDYRVPKWLRPIINGSAHHSDHHLYFNYNYGEYLTLWDRLGGSFREPSAYLGNGLHDDMAKMARGEQVSAEDFEEEDQSKLKKAKDSSASKGGDGLKRRVKTGL